MTDTDVKQDTALTINWLRVNLPTIAAVVGVGFYVGIWQTQIQATLVAVQSDMLAIKGQMQNMQNIPYRIDVAEQALRDTNGRVDALSNTLIGQLDLVRRDVNRLTTTVEVLNARVGVLTGDIDDPVRRRSRPAPHVDDAARD